MNISRRQRVTMEPVHALATLQQLAEARRIAQQRPCAVSRGSFVQRYDAETLQLVDHFAGPTEAIRQFEFGCPQILMRATKDNTIYKGYRWASVPRDQDPTVPQELPPTVDTRQSCGGMVAVYSRDETFVEYVFPDQTSTRKFLNIKSAASVSQAISSNLRRKCAGVYIQMWSEVPQKLKELYLQSKQLPEAVERKGGRPILQLDMLTGIEIERHNNIAAVARDFRMSQMTVKKACETGKVYAGFRWMFDE